MIGLPFIFFYFPSHNIARRTDLNDGHSFRFQSAYYPFLNICEWCFSVWEATFKMAEMKEQLLQQDHSTRIASMIQAAEQAINSVTTEIASDMYRKT